jgi:hypothetical protein
MPTKQWPKVTSKANGSIEYFAPSDVSPNQEGIASFRGQINFGTDGQEDFGGHVAKRQACQYGNLQLRTLAVYHCFQFKTFVVCDQFVGGKLSKHNDFLLLKYTRIEQLRQHALDFVRMFAHIF